MTSPDSRRITDIDAPLLKAWNWRVSTGRPAQRETSICQLYANPRGHYAIRSNGL